jgi:hypothetical protein
MKWQVYVGVALLASVGAMILGLAGAHAQTATDMDRLWCIQMRNSIMRNYRAVENIRAARQAGINKLRAEHQLPATRNLEQWYWKKVEAIFQQKRAVDAECNWMNVRRDAPSPGRMAPLPRPRQPRPNETWRYPPYERYPEPNDPFSPGRQR